MRKLAFMVLMAASFSWGWSQSKEKLLAKESVYIYNNGLDTIELSDPGDVYYVYCKPYDSAGYKQTRRKAYHLRMPPLLRHPAVVDSIPGSLLSAHRGSAIDWFYNSECYSIALLDSVQVNGKGSKELVFHRGIKGNLSFPQASVYGVCSVILEKIEVWDIDSKELLWEQVTQFNFFDNQNNPGVSFYVSRSFEFEFSMADNGLITLVDQFGFKEIRGDPMTDKHQSLLFLANGEVIVSPVQEDNRNITEHPVCPAFKERTFFYVGNGYTEL